MRSLNFDNSKPLLYLVATPIGNLDEMSPRALEVIKEADLIACEDTRVTSKLLSLFNISKPLVSLREHNETSEANILIPQIKAGKKVVYMSDAGYPCISDPGAKLVCLALENEINVSCVSGPNAALNALVASGLPCDHFYFYGFLSAKQSERKTELENLKEFGDTLIFYEAPHRILKTLNDLLDVLGDRKACLARELTKKHEEFIRMNLSELVALDEDTLKGEMVIIVEGKSKEEIKIDVTTIIKTVDYYILDGYSKKDAIKEASKKLGLNKNQVYDIYHKGEN